MKKILLTIVLVVLICTEALAESSVWKIQKDGGVLYLGGTIHLLRQSDFPLPPEFEEAFKKSDILVLETDLGKFKDPATQRKLVSKALYADGSTLDKHMSARTYTLLDKYCASIGISLSKFQHFKPSIIAVTMANAELAKLGVGQEGVDTFFYQLAVRDKKGIEGLETVDEQIAYIVEMGEGNEDAFITHSINDLESIKQDYENMVNAWKHGDAEKLDELIVDDLKTKLPKLYKELLADRTHSWLPKIEAYRRTSEREFILVGAGHLVGSDGLLEVLERQGYTVEKL
jgi:hypothetical protein